MLAHGRTVEIEASDALRQRLGADRSQVMAMVNGSWTGMRVGGKIDGKEVEFSIDEILDMVTNGMLFHEDPSHREAVEMFMNEPRWAYLWPTIHFKIMPIKNATVMLFRYLLRDGSLSEADYPEERRAAKHAWETAKNNPGDP